MRDIEKNIREDEAKELKRSFEERTAVKAGSAELTESVTSLLTNMPGLTFSKDASNGKYLACNQFFAEYAHKESPAGVVGLTDFDIFDKDTAEHFTADDKYALSLDEPYIFYENVPDAAGNPRHFQTTKLKFTDDCGRLCLLGMCVDVSEMMKIKEESTTYSRIARALATDYAYLYYVDLQTDQYVEYSSHMGHEELSIDRKGEDFFRASKEQAESLIYAEDRDAFIESFTKENVLRGIDENGAFTLSYRLIIDGVPTYVNLKASRMQEDDSHIIIGVNNVDAQMKIQEAAERIKEEQTTYSRISALSGDYICIYTVDPDTEYYSEYLVTKEYEGLGLAKEGNEFFSRARTEGMRTLYLEDLDRYLSMMTRENVMREIEKNGLFVLEYRLMIEGVPTYVSLKAAMVEEKDGPQLIIGVSNIDARVKREQEYAYNLTEARNQANLDALTGVKNKHAYIDIEAQLDHQIEENMPVEFAIAVFDVNGLKEVNDTQGHQAGDRYIRQACSMICNAFKRSPVFRVGGDEFAVIIQGYDYDRVEELMETLENKNKENTVSGEVVVASGMAKYERDRNVSAVFERADNRMYANKKMLKEIA